MFFSVEMRICIPHGADGDEIKSLQKAEQERVRELQRSGKWRHIWRIPGRWENLSILEVVDADELHTILSELPLFKYMEIQVTALAQHPAAIDR